MIYVYVFLLTPAVIRQFTFMYFGGVTRSVDEHSYSNSIKVHFSQSVKAKAILKGPTVTLINKTKTLQPCEQLCEANAG